MTPSHSFVRRLRFGLGALIATSLLGLIAVGVAERHVQGSLRRSAEAVSLLEDLGGVGVSFSAARAAEREFLLEDLRTPNFFQSGSSPALEGHARALADLRVLLARIEGHPRSDALPVQEIREAVSAYEETFRELVALYRERGSLYTGELGKLREASFAFQERLGKLSEGPQTVLRAELLELIRDQGDYQRDLDNRPRFLVGERLAILREESAGVPKAERQALLAAIASYETAWERLLEIDDRIGRSSGAALRGELRGAQETLVPLTRAALERARAGVDEAARSARQAAAMARSVTAGAVLLAGTMAVFLAGSLARQVREPLHAMLAAVDAYAKGDRGARVGPLPRRDEFATLATSLDRMAETLSEATDELEEINASLELAVKGDTSGLLERIKTLVAQRKPTGLPSSEAS